MAERRRKSAGRWWRRLLLLVAIILVLPILTVSALWISDSGRNWITAQISMLAANPDLDIALAGLGGTTPWDGHLQQIRISDAEGVWLQAEGLSWTLAPSALLNRRVVVEKLLAEKIIVHRQPVIPESQEPAPTEQPAEFSLRSLSLPIDFLVETVQVAQLQLEQPVIGHAMAVSLAGMARSDSEGIYLQLATNEQQDGQKLDPGLMLSLDMMARPEQDQLQLNLDFMDRADGIVAALSGLSPDEGFSAQLQGSGPLSGWQGQLQARAGTLAVVDLALDIAHQQSTDLAIAGTAQIAEMLPAAARPLVSDQITLDLGLSLDDQQLQLSPLQISSEDLVIEANLANAIDTGEILGQGQVTLKDPAPVNSLIAPQKIAGLQMPFQLMGSISHPELIVRPALRGIELPQGHIAAADAQIRVHVADDIRLNFNAAATDVALNDPNLQSLVGDAVSAHLAATLDAQSQAVDVQQMQLELASLQLKGKTVLTKTAEGANKILPSIDIVIKPQEQAILPLHGRSQLSGEIVARDDGHVAGQVKLQGEGWVYTIEQLAALLGTQPVLQTGFQLTPSGRLELADTRLQAQALNLSASGHLDPPADQMAFTVSANTDNLAALEPTLNGGLELVAEITGASNLPRADLAIDSTGLQVQSKDLGELSGRLSFQQKTAETARLDLSALRLGALQIAGGADIDLANTLAHGAFELRQDDLAQFSAIAGASVQGRLAGDLQLAADSGRQRLVIRLDGRDLAFDGMQLEKTSLSGSALLDEAGQPALDLALQLQALAGLPLDLAEAEILVRGNPQDLSLVVTADGAFVEAFSTAARAQVQQKEDAIYLRLAQWQARHGEDEFALAAPAQIRFAAADDLQAEAALTVNEGSIDILAKNTPSHVDIRAVMDALPLAAFAGFADVPQLQELAGHLGGRVTLTGSPTAPRLESDLALRDVALLDAEDIPKLAADAKTQLVNGKLTTDIEVSGFSDQPATLSAELQRLSFSLQPFAVALPGDAPLQADIAWQGQLAAVQKQIGLDDHLIAGLATLDGHAEGTLAAPAITGQLTLADGRYENVALGTLLQDLTLDLGLADNVVSLATLQAGDGAEGQIQGSGRFLLEEAAAGDRGDLNIRFDNFRAVARDDVTAAISGNLGLQGRLRKLQITGDFRTERVDVDISGNAPPGVAVLDVQEVNRPGEATPPPAEETEPEAEPAVSLDVRLAIPNRLYVRGRGLESEWKGAFTATGSAFAPIVEGQLEPIRGSLTLGGRQLDLAKSEIIVDKRETEPRLDLNLEYNGKQLKAIISVEGPASTPTVTLSSEPPRPEDEVLAAILFDRPTGQLTAVEALQLAQAAITLRGGGGGGFDPLGTIREGLQLDQLSVTADEAGDSRLEAGKYLSDEIYVGVEQGIGAASGAAKVELQLLPNVYLEGKTKVDNTSNVGIKWQRDY